MKKTAIISLLLSFALTLVAPCSFAVEVYTFKKDRVDQELSGNRGYISGKPKNIPEKKRDLKRTLIGIDIELPVEADDESSGGPEYRPSPEKKKTGPKTPSSSKPVTVVGDDKEETWIK